MYSSHSATSSFQKNHNEPPKVAQLAKIAQSGHPAEFKIRSY
jgi:hypothetical protein